MLQPAKCEAPSSGGYGHYVVFISAAAGAVLAMAVDQATHHLKLIDTQADGGPTSGGRRQPAPSRRRS